TLPPGDILRPEVIEEFDAMLGALQIDTIFLDKTRALQALSRLTDPLITATGGAASLRLANDLELRISAPLGWFRRSVTQSAAYPSVYFFENDPRSLEEGESIQGAVMQVSLIGQGRLRGLLAEPNSDIPGDLALAYL